MTSVRDIVLAEVAPPGFKGTVKAMKRKHGFSNKKAYALAWSMKNKGDRSHYKADGTHKESVDEAFVTREQLLRDFPPNPVVLRQLRAGTYNTEAAAAERDVAKEHQLNVARRTLKMPDAMAGVMGGMTKDQARRIVQNHAGSFAARVRGYQETDESLRLVQPGTTGWRDKSFGAAERRQQIRARVHQQGTVHGVQSERVLKKAAAAVQQGRMKEDVNATWSQLVDEKKDSLTDPVKYELMYSGGGHGGPYLGAQAAYKGAKRMLKGGSDRAVTIARYAKPGEQGLFIPRFTVRKDGTSSSMRPMMDPRFRK